MPLLFEALARVVERKADTRYGALDLWRDYFGGAPVNSGVSVTWLNSLQVTTVLACARRICEALSVSCKVYQRNSETGRRREAREHPLYRVLTQKPNKIQTSIEYRETIGLHTALTGNHFSLIERVGGKIDALTPIDPANVDIRFDDDGDLYYRVTFQDGTVENVRQQDIWHVRGLSWDAYCGLDAVRLAREAIGLALATEEAHARLHSNALSMGGIISFKSGIKPELAQRVKAQLEANYVGVANRFKTVILDNDAHFTPMMQSGVDAQHVQVRQLQIEEICRAMGVMPIMAGYSGDKAPTYASAEQLFLAHLVHTARPWHDRVAGSADRWLLTDKEREDGYYVGFVDAAFLSPAMKDKAEYYKIALGGGGNPGWITPNEVRGFDENDELPGGDTLYVPANVYPIGPDGMPMIPRQPAAPKPGGTSEET